MAFWFWIYFLWWDEPTITDHTNHWENSFILIKEIKVCYLLQYHVWYFEAFVFALYFITHFSQHFFAIRFTYNIYYLDSLNIIKPPYFALISLGNTSLFFTGDGGAGRMSEALVHTLAISWRERFRGASSSLSARKFAERNRYLLIRSLSLIFFSLQINQITCFLLTNFPSLIEMEYTIW